MPKRVLDTNKLLDLWHGRMPGCPVRRIDSIGFAKQAATWWLSHYPSDGILTPIRLEFYCGVRSRDELKLADKFLSHFPLFDMGSISNEDWQEAIRLSRRVKNSGRSRGAIDCLIVAICKRLHLELWSNDSGLPG